MGLGETTFLRHAGMHTAFSTSNTEGTTKNFNNIIGIYTHVCRVCTTITTTRAHGEVKPTDSALQSSFWLLIFRTFSAGLLYEEKCTHTKKSVSRCFLIQSKARVAEVLLQMQTRKVQIVTGKSLAGKAPTRTPHKYQLNTHTHTAKHRQHRYSYPVFLNPPTQAPTHRKRKAKCVYDQLGEQPKIKKKVERRRQRSFTKAYNMTNFPSPSQKQLK